MALAKYLDRVDENTLHSKKRDARVSIKDNTDDDNIVQKYIAASAKFGYSFTTLPNRIGLSYKDFNVMLKENPHWFWSHVSGVQKYIEGLEKKYSRHLLCEDADETTHLAKKFDHWKRTIGSCSTDLAALINKYSKELVDKDFLKETTDLMMTI